MTLTAPRLAILAAALTLLPLTIACDAGNSTPAPPSCAGPAPTPLQGYQDQAGGWHGPVTTMPPCIAAECYALGYQDTHPCYQHARGYGWATEPWYQ